MQSAVIMSSNKEETRTEIRAEVAKIARRMGATYMFAEDRTSETPTEENGPRKRRYLPSVVPFEAKDYRHRRITRNGPVPYPPRVNPFPKFMSYTPVTPTSVEETHVETKHSLMSQWQSMIGIPPEFPPEEAKATPHDGEDTNSKISPESPPEEGKATLSHPNERRM